MINYVEDEGPVRPMTPTLETGVERRLESPREGEPVRLIVGLESTTDEALEQLRSAGATVEDELPLDNIAVSTTEERLEDLASLSVVTSLEIDTKGTVFTADF